jgi:hypothetical protein
MGGALFGECGSHFDNGRVRRRNAEVEGENLAEFFGASQGAPLGFLVAVTNGELIVEKGVAMRVKCRVASGRSISRRAAVAPVMLKMPSRLRSRSPPSPAPRRLPEASELSLSFGERRASRLASRINSGLPSA